MAGYERNVAGQALTVFAFDVVTGLGKTGDGANLTLFRSVDDGTLTQVTDTTATEIDATNAPGYYRFDLSQTEVNGQYIHYFPKSSTTSPNNVGVTVHWPAFTVPANFSTTAMRGTDNALLAASAPTNFGDLAVTATTGQVTVGTNNDKTGYTVSTNSDKTGYSVSALSAGVITDTSIAADAITAAKIAAGAIDAATFAAGAIDAAAIATDAITAAKIANGAIDAATFAAGAIDATAIAADAITAAKVADGAIDAATFAAGAINAAAIAADAITAAKIAADAITAAKVAADVHAETAAAVVDLDKTGHSIANSFGEVLSALPTATAGSPGGLALYDDILLPLNDGTIDDATPSTTSFDLSSGFSTNDDDYNSMILVVHYATGRRIARPITDYVGASQTVTVSPALPAIPVNGSRVQILGYFG